MGNEVSSHKKKERKGKAENGDFNGHAVNLSSNNLTETMTTEVTVEQTTDSSTFNGTTKMNASPVEASSDSQTDEAVEEHSQEQSTDTTTAEQTKEALCITPEEEEPKPPGKNKPNFFDKLFNKKSNTKPVEVDVETQSEQINSADQVDAVEEATDDQKSEPVDVQDSPEPELSEKESLQSSPTVTEQNQTEENPVMNFFKTLVTPAKTPKEAAAASSDVSKDQSQKESAATTAPANVQEVDVAKGKVAPPPPPEPPKMEGKTEPTVKKEESQDAPKETDTGAKPKAAKESPFSKFFRPKAAEEAAAPVAVQPDASSAATLEASAKPEPAPAVKEEDKAEKKPSPFASLLKPKAAEPTEDTCVVAAKPDAPQGAKAKEEAKAAPPAAPPAPPADKSVESAENASPTIPRREKRNSIQLFFKNLVSN